MTIDSAVHSILHFHSCTAIYPMLHKISKAFFGGLFLERLIFGGVYLQREICVSKSIGLALQLEGNLLFFLCFTLYLKAKYKPGGGEEQGRAHVPRLALCQHSHSSVVSASIRRDKDQLQVFTLFQRGKCLSYRGVPKNRVDCKFFYYLKKLSVYPAVLTVSVYLSPKIFSGPF